MANEKNLIPVTKRSRREMLELSSRGGIKSGESRRRTRDLKKAFELALATEISTKDGKKVTCAEGIARTVISKALRGEVKSVQQILDLFYGRKQEVEMKGSVVTKLPDLNINFMAAQEDDNGGEPR